MDEEGKKKPTCEPLGVVLAGLIEKCRDERAGSAAAVRHFWDQVVGERLACNAQPAAYKQRTLVVHVTGSVWLQELHFQKDDLIARLNQAAGASVVDDIRFKLGSLPTK